ncbi:GPI ethanolamine phosphate transferase 3-like [Tigriopus californicus]|uniref:GPI ethanolamine phosphate transferase 3-like n=1 Tax=Tigriopus californicus TaxID=6832 RepID=UPI0027DAB43B|nr:GPI ethanolamine phosphate transferase 3-like [Tigriopus californicus]
MWSTFKYLLFLLWMSYVFVCCLFLFTGGFLLRRQVLTNKSECLSRDPCHPRAPPIFAKAVIILIDAFKYEFALHDDGLVQPMHFQNNLPILSRLERSGQGKLFEFMADPPTTTLQRLKGLTTGSLPTFIDASSNFGTDEIPEDNILFQVNGQDLRAVFAGDDTWMGLYPNQFLRSFPYPSFDVWDLDTVDKGVNEHFFPELNHTDWHVLIAHYLGVDHAGHKHGPYHPEMKRKLTEMNQVIERVIDSIGNDTILFVMGDHGMTASGDHGGDSSDELSAALFAYSPKFNFQTNLKPAREVVEQVDFVPTLSLLLGIPIPYSNLGKLIPSLFGSNESNSFILPYLDANLRQVMNFLEGYRAHGGNLPKNVHDSLRNRFESYEEISPSFSDVPGTIRSGFDILRNAKKMCQSVWAEFNLTVMGLGLILFLMQLCLILLLILTPKTHLIASILNSGFVTHLWISSIIGAGLGMLFPLSQHIRPEKGVEFVLFASSSFSVMAFGFNLLWKLLDSAGDLISSLYNSCGKRPLLCLGFVLFQVFMVSTNSFVVYEAEVMSFMILSSVIFYLLELKAPTPETEANPKIRSNSREVIFFLVLVIMGLVKLCTIYFRCREEQLGFCFPTEFHKPIGTLPKDTSYRDYKNRRFCSTMLSVVVTVLLPHFWLKNCGNLNGFSVSVCLASYVPPTCGISMVFYWAIQGHEVGTKLLPWQQNILAQVAMVLCLTALVAIIIQPKLVYRMENTHAHSEVMPHRSNGIHGYFKFMSSHWKNHFTMDSVGGRQKINVFGLGTAFSAPFLFIQTILCLGSMLLLGDGLCPSLGLAFVLTHLILYVDTAIRLGSISTLEQIFNVPWSTVVGYWLLESLLFYATGHQPTFSSIQWNAAFVGISGSNYGTDTTLAGFLIPVVMVGWNTFTSRIIYGICLPILLISPFTMWLRFPDLRRQFQTAAVEVKTLESQDLDQGELVLVEFQEETRSNLLKLCAKYCWLQALRLFGTMLAATVLRRHLMVWKIFAPRFIFEAIGFLVSLVSVVIGYCVFSRIHISLIRYYRMLQKNK